jgi:hypothetical protein
MLLGFWNIDSRDFPGENALAPDKNVLLIFQNTDTGISETKNRERLG